MVFLKSWPLLWLLDTVFSAGIDFGDPGGD